MKALERLGRLAWLGVPLRKLPHITNPRQGSPAWTRYLRELVDIWILGETMSRCSEASKGNVYAAVNDAASPYMFVICISRFVLKTR